MRTVKSGFLLLVLMMLATLKSVAIDYSISFAGTGLENVMVQNLTKGSNVTLQAGNVLNLKDVITNVEHLSIGNEGMSISSNSDNGRFTISFLAEQAGLNQVIVYKTNGKKLIEETSHLQVGECSFQLTVPQGVYLLKVYGNGYSYSAKLLSQYCAQNQANITFDFSGKKGNPAIQKSKSNLIEMQYSVGDQLLYKGISGNSSTIITDVPIASKTINFNFIECKDGDGNYYSVVKIGSLTWMAENLKTTKYRNGVDVIPNVSSATAWAGLTTGAYCDYNNTPNYFGKLYNWYAVADSRNLAPTGWHVATNDEWTTLQDYLIANGYNYNGLNSFNNIAKSLAANVEWISCPDVGVIGNNLSQNNASGFSALPGGNRHNDGSFSYFGYDGIWWTSTEYYTRGCAAEASRTAGSGLDRATAFYNCRSGKKVTKYGLFVHK